MSGMKKRGRQILESAIAFVSRPGHRDDFEMATGTAQTTPADVDPDHEIVSWLTLMARRR